MANLSPHFQIDSHNNITVTQGDIQAIVFQITDANDAAIDITGYTFFFTVKTKPDDDVTDASAIVKKNWDSHTTPVSGITTLNLTAAEMSIPLGVYYYDVQMQSGANDPVTILSAKFTTIYQITNRMS